MKVMMRAVFVLAAVLGQVTVAAGQGPDDAMPRLAPTIESETAPPVMAPANGPAASAASAQAAPHPNSLSVPLPAGCESNPKAIGLARIVEIDTAGGTRLGHSQYKDVDFLQDGEVVLTFDDGPMRRYTKPILDTLDAHCTRATFFSVGKMALADPQTLQETAARGHTIASHTWSHAKLTTVTAAQAKYEIELGNSAVTLALGFPTSAFFRFPYLRDTKASGDYLRSRNMSAVSIEVDSQDFRTRNPGLVLRNVMSQLKAVKKGIILFHDIQPATVGALSSLLDNLQASGFKVVQLISKKPSTTLPEYDAMARKEMARRSISVAAAPAGAGPLPAARNGQPVAKLPKPATAQSALPWESVTGTPPPDEPTAIPADNESPAQTRPPRKPLWYRDDDPWRIKTFSD